MNFGGASLASCLQGIRGRIEAACGRAGRDPRQVTLIGVTKTVPAEVVRDVAGLGLRDLGENRVQEAAAKIDRVGREPLRWHMIGHLQRNKAGRAAELFDRVHGVDDRELAETLSRRAVALGRRLSALVEVNVSGEASKFGVAPEALESLLEAIVDLPGLEVDGLMTVGPRVESAEDARAGFARLRGCRDRAEQRLGRALPELSMGMSDDFEVAIEEGATFVRVGTALFGARA